MSHPLKSERLMRHVQHHFEPNSAGSEMNYQKGEYEKVADTIGLVNDSEISSIRNIVSGIVRIINDPQANPKDLQEIIQADPPLASRLLRLVNSAYYSPPNKIVEIMKAVVWIGWDAIRELALSQKVCKIFDKDESIDGYSRRSLWKHSLAVAILAKMIYRREFGDRGENVYVAGLLHDLGIIIEDQFHHTSFSQVLSKSKRERKNLIGPENETFGYDHGVLGKAITDSWDLPEEICFAIGNHHGPNGAAGEFSRMAYTLYVADCCCQKNSIGYGDAPFIDPILFDRCLKMLDLTEHSIALIVQDMEKEILNMEDQGFF
jgi:putative nucleotidyltransferase with HDIG domain